MTNKEIIKVLYEIADILEVKGENKFKIRAYQKLAQFLTTYDKELSEIYKKEGKKGLLKLPNVGEGIAKKLEELINTGKLNYLEELKRDLPEGIDTFLKIPGMGPKTAFLIADKFKIKTISELEKLIKEKKLRNLKGFGEKIEQKILKGIELYKKGEERKLLIDAYNIADKIINYLKQKCKIKKINIAGSLRRMTDTVGDIDILVVSDESLKLMDEFCNMEIVDYVIAKGEKKSSVRTIYNIQVDLRVIENDSYGAALQYFTGSKTHNVLLREFAVKKGYKLNEYGLYKGNKKIAGDDERDIYEKLGLQFIPPELREGGEEIEFAKNKKIPELVQYKDIKGDFHIHTNYSDGINSIEEYVNEAKKYKYHYIAITDHSKSLKVANGLTEDRVLKQIEEIDKLNKKINNFYIFKGIEVDILEDGSLDMPEHILKQLDVVIGSIHKNFKMNKQDMTERILKAMDNKYINVIGHISGRLINSREGYELDYEKIFKKAAKENIAIEINAQPERLDLRDIYVKEAISKGVKIIIGTDSHTKDSIFYMYFGVGKVRKGWAQKEDIINTFNIQKIKKWIDLRRK